MNQEILPLYLNKFERYLLLCALDRMMEAYLQEGGIIPPDEDTIVVDDPDTFLYILNALSAMDQIVEVLCDSSEF